MTKGFLSSALVLIPLNEMNARIMTCAFIFK
jgi:hypothetical protein